MANGKQRSGKKNAKQNSKSNGKVTGFDSSALSKLTPQQIAVIVGLITNSLTVDSVLVDKDQTIQIVLEGSLRRKTRMDELLEEISEMNVGDVLESLVNRYT